MPNLKEQIIATVQSIFMQNPLLQQTIDYTRVPLYIDDNMFAQLIEGITEMSTKKQLQKEMNNKQSKQDKIAQLNNRKSTYKLTFFVLCYTMKTWDIAYNRYNTTLL
jgi:hypothetical protein